MSVASPQEAEVAFGRVLQRIAQPLGLLKPPYDKGVRYQDALFHHILQQPDYLIAMDKPMMMIFKTLVDQEHEGRQIRAGTLGDNFLFMVSFFPSYLTQRYRRFGDDEQRMRAHVYSAIRGLYERSRNPHVKDARLVIAENVPAYVQCMTAAANHFIEEDEDIAQGVARLDALVQKRMREMPSTLDDLFSQDTSDN